MHKVFMPEVENFVQNAHRMRKRLGTPEAEPLKKFSTPCGKACGKLLPFGSVGTELHRSLIALLNAVEVCNSGFNSFCKTITAQPIKTPRESKKVGNLQGLV